MKILFCGYRNPNFPTVTEYSEKAFLDSGCEADFFNDRGFLLPERFRRRARFLDALELSALNRRLVEMAARSKPDIMFACGGLRVRPEALKALGDMGIKRVLWTLDAPTDGFKPLFETAPLYERVFCAGSEAVDLLRGAGVKNAELLPFACDPAIHRLRELDAAERARYGCDVAFVGSVHPGIYPGRVEMLESLSDIDLKVWGPGADAIPASSPLKKRVMGAHMPPELWTKIYSAAKITLGMHYADPGKRYPCWQASPRVFEAMACGTFLLCDAQKDVLSVFEEGRHLAVFRDERELREKAEYYLADKGKREAIAAAGRQEVLTGHTYRIRMERVLRSLN